MNTKIITRPIWLLSLVSLFADLASEMLYPIMPVYLHSIGFSIALIGLLEGVAEATAGLSKGYFGHLSDQWGRRLPFVRLGYSFSALSKPMMALFSLPGWVFAARTLDRLGKGVRTGARDALLADQSLSRTRGQVFGFHRSMDTLGGVLGPVAALVYLYYFPGHYVPLFLLAFGPGLLSVGLTFLLTDQKASQPTPDLTGPPARAASVFSFLHYWRASPTEYRRVVGGLLAFALFNSSDIFLLLKVKEAGLDDTTMVGLYIFYNLVYALMAYPVGLVADRLGLKPTLLVGLGLFALVYQGMMVANRLPLFIGLFGLYGVCAAATEGIAKAWISTVSGPKDTATAIGTYAGLSSLCALVANSLAGWLWYAFGSVVTFGLTSAATVGVIVYLVAMEAQRQSLPSLRTFPVVFNSDGGPIGSGAAEDAEYSLPKKKSTGTRTRSAIIALLLLLACLGAWTAYVSVVTVSPLLQTKSGTGAASGNISSAYTVPSLTGIRRSDMPQPAKADARTGRSNPIVAQNQSIDSDPLAAEPSDALEDKATSPSNKARTGRSLTARGAPVKAAELKLKRVRLYTTTGLYTHLYTEPNKRSRRRAFVNLWKKVVLTALKEKNGFYYVVYTNRKGQTVNGWLPKKALRPLRLAGPLYSL